MNSKSIPINNIDMLFVFDAIQIKNDEKISQPDKEFCQQQQNLLYESLSQIDKWYEIFCKEAEIYKESHKTSFTSNGFVTVREPYDPDHSLPLNYKKHEFKPFDSINEMVKKNLSAIKCFSNTIISHFNQKYNISIPYPDIDEENTPIGCRPVYTTYVDIVINYLGGKGFRETSEEEIFKRFHSAILFDHTKKEKPELKGDKIAFYDIIGFDEFYFKYKEIRLSYNYRNELEHFCAGIALSGAEQLNGDSGIIQGLNTSNIIFTEWYSLSAGLAKGMKFYKNGRIDVKFSDKTSAEQCFRRLRLA